MNARFPNPLNLSDAFFQRPQNREPIHHVSEELWVLHQLRVRRFAKVLVMRRLIALLHLSDRIGEHQRYILTTYCEAPAVLGGDPL